MPEPVNDNGKVRLVFSPPFSVEGREQHVRTQVEMERPMPAEKTKRERLSHHKVSALVFSALFGVAVLVLVIFSDAIGPAILDWILTWWAAVCGAYILTQLIPLTAYDPLEESRERADLLSSTLVAGLIFVGIPIWFVAKGHLPSWWAVRIWANSIPTSVADIIIMLILYKISRATVRTSTE